MKKVFIFTVLSTLCLFTLSYSSEKLNLNEIIWEYQPLNDKLINNLPSENPDYLNGLSLNDSLLLAALAGDEKKVNEILNSGADLNYQNTDGYNLLICASISGLNNFAKRLLENNTLSINSQVLSSSFKGYTSLHFALMYDRYDVAELLIKNEADVNLKDWRGYTPIFELIFSMNRKDNKLENNKEHILINLFIDSGADLNIETGSSSLLSTLIAYDMEDMADFFIEHGCNANDFWALEICIADNNLDYLKKLINHGADLDLYKTGFSLLFTAVEGNLYDMAEYLIEHGSSLNIRNDNKWHYDGWTPLMAASDTAGLRFIKLLIKHNADPDLQDVNGETALMKACRINSPAAVKELLKVKHNIELADAEGWSPVHFAARYGNSEIIRILTDYGFNINSTDSYGFTPLMLAVWNNHIETVKMLLKIGSHTNTTVKKGDYKGLTAYNLVTSEEMKNILPKIQKSKTPFAPKSETSDSLLISNAKWLKKTTERTIENERYPTYPEIEMLINIGWHTELTSDIHFISYYHPLEGNIVMISIPESGSFFSEEERVREKFPQANDSEIGERMRIKRVTIKDKTLKDTLYHNIKSLSISPVIDSWIVLDGDSYKIRIYGFPNFNHYMTYELTGPVDHPLSLWCNDTAEKLFEVIKNPDSSVKNTD